MLKRYGSGRKLVIFLVPQKRNKLPRYTQLEIGLPKKGRGYEKKLYGDDESLFARS